MLPVSALGLRYVGVRVTALCYSAYLLHILRKCRMTAGIFFAVSAMGLTCRATVECDGGNFRKDFRDELDNPTLIDDISSDKLGIINKAASTSEDFWPDC